MNEVRYAIRGLRRNPRFTFTATLTLALGIGANAAIFSIINTVYLRPLPYPEPDRLVAARKVTTDTYLEWRQNRAFTSVGAWGWDVATLRGGADWPERVQVQRIAGDYLQTLNVHPLMGRRFGANEAGCPILISARLWRTWFSADPAVVGRPVTAERENCQVVGIMPESFLPPASASNRVEAWMPLRVTPGDRQSLIVLARLAPGVAGRIHPHLMPLKDFIVGAPPPAMYALAGAVGFLLMLACINVATLLSARAGGQRREIAIRSALGAGPWRLIRHSLIQAFVLALLGGMSALVITFWSLDGLVWMARDALPRLNEAEVDWRVLTFMLLVSIAAGFGFGLAPAISLSRSALREPLRRSETRFWQSLQIVAEVASATVLLVGGGLLLRSFQAIRAVDLGFATEHVFFANLSAPPGEPARHVHLLSAILERIHAIPGVVSATATVGVPMRGSTGRDFEVFGRAADPREKLHAETAR